MQQEAAKMKQWIEKFGKWIASLNPQGVGTLLVGIAALWALTDSSSVIKDILKVQDQARDIATAVEEIKHQSFQLASAIAELKIQSAQISSAIDLLGTQLKEMKAAQTVERSPVLKSQKSSKAQIGDVIKQLPVGPGRGVSQIYIPAIKLEDTIERIYKAKSPEERETILGNSLEYQPAGAKPKFE